MKYAIYDNTGAFIEAHNTERVTELPQSAIEMTDAQFNDWQNFAPSADGKAAQASPKQNDAAADKHAKSIDLQNRIEAIEAKKQPRALRDFALRGDTARLQEIDAEIAGLRAQLVA